MSYLQPPPTIAIPPDGSPLGIAEAARRVSHTSVVVVHTLLIVLVVRLGGRGGAPALQNIRRRQGAKGFVGYRYFVFAT